MPDSAIGQYDWYSQIGASPTARTWPVVANVDEGGSITGISANGINIPTSAAYTLPAKLGQIVSANTPNQLIYIVSGSDVGFLGLGVAQATDVPQRSHVDTRFPRIFTAAEGAAGNDGDYGFRPDLGLFRTKAAGAWGDVQPPTATGEQLYNGTYPAASHAGRSRFVTTWGQWTINDWFTSDGTDWYPSARVLRLGSRVATAATSSITNVALATDNFPQNMLKGCHVLEAQAVFICTGTAATKTPKAWFTAGGGGIGGTAAYSIATATTGLIATPKLAFYFASDAVQNSLNFSTNAQPFVSSGGDDGNYTVDVTAAAGADIAWGGLVAAGTETMLLQNRYYEARWPSIRT